ncbi:hypothetical protein HK405_001522, partial [Cladochytrium tenue]
TTNFVHGVPFVAVSLGLLHRREPVVGVVYNPILDELYHARSGGGAFLHGYGRLPLAVATSSAGGGSGSVPRLATSLVATEYGYERDEARLSAKLGAAGEVLRASVRGVRSLGSAALTMCYVARGSLDAYWEAGVHAWDVAGAAAVLREAGGVAVNFAPAARWRRRGVGTAAADAVAGEAGEAGPPPPHMEFMDVADRRFIAVRSFGAGNEAAQDEY